MKRFADALNAVFDPDRALQVAMDAAVEATAAAHALRGPREAWTPGKPLKLYLAGYVGARNTGADIRVEEMIRQLRTLIGDDNLELTLPTFDRRLSGSYFRAVRQMTAPLVFPPFLFDQVPRHHGVVACEGSMFKSKFSSALSAMMAGALGLAAAEGKLGVGYGAEAGEMTGGLRRFVARQCRQSLVLCRNEQSRTVLNQLGVRTGPGADTAWTFEPAPPERGAQILSDAGWDGERPVLAVCPINPFWWPVKPDLLRAIGHEISGQADASHYKSVYFHRRSEEVERKTALYLDGVAEGVAAFAEESGAFVVVAGMEQIDRPVCEQLAARLPGGAPLFVSDEHDMYELVSVLRNCSQILSSRFHAIVTSMPALVPSAGITMDERIANLLRGRGDPELLLFVDDDDLGERVLAVLRRLRDDGDGIRGRIARAIPIQLQRMGEMGVAFLDELCAVYPDFPRKDRSRHWLDHLPPLPAAVAKLVEEQG